MKRTNGQKGITLIALIITIVVLLILAAVAISSITDNGILGHATNAATKYNGAVQNEQAMLDYYEAYLAGTLRELTIDGTTYNYVAGMTWGEWVDSSYNTIGAKIMTTTDNREMVVVEKNNQAYVLFGPDDAWHIYAEADGSLEYDGEDWDNVVRYPDSTRWETEVSSFNFSEIS